jgi:hypothetical protein
MFYILLLYHYSLTIFKISGIVFSQDIPHYAMGSHPPGF